MRPLHTCGALTSGLTEPEQPQKDDAHELGGGVGIEVQGAVGSPDSASKLIATATARAALLGIEVRELQDGAWLLQHASGPPIGVVQGLDGLRAAVDGFHAARDDVADLVLRIGARALPPALQSDDCRRVMALTERLQRAGWTLARADSGPAVFTVSRWSMLRELRDLAAVEAFARQVGATA